MSARMKVLAVIACVVSCSTAAADGPVVRVAFNIPPQPIGRALTELGEQAGLQVLVRGEDIRHDQALSPAVVGDLPVRAALERVLANSGLTYEFLDDRTVRVRLAAVQQSPEPSPAPARPTESSRSTGEERLEEIVVSAQKRDERIQDVPLPVTALSAAALVDAHQNRLQDYYSSVPGLNLALDNRGSPAIAVRGLTTTIYGNPTVATVIDDVPYSGATSASFSWAATEFDPAELERVEVLRGPQGVLYGASSLGGLIKFVTVKPSITDFSGRLQVSGNSVIDGGAGFGASGAVNVPVGNEFAVRASGFFRQDPGYVDNVLTGERDVNDAHVGGARVSGLWKPSDTLSFQLSALYQSSSTGGSPNVERTDVAGNALADLQQSYIRGSGAYDRTLQAYTATVHADLGAVDLTSISGYAISNSEGSFDTSNLAFTQNFSQSFYGVPFTAWVEDNETRKFSQELRFSGALSERVDWMVGGFYTDETTDLKGGQFAFQGVSGTQLGSWFTSSGPVTYEEKAAFAYLTPRFTSRFDMQFGVRYSTNDQTFEQTTAFGTFAPVVAPRLASDESSVTYLVSPSYHVTDDVMVYARIASGFRPGGINTAVTATSGNPREFGPDKTQNYELGVKGTFLDNRLVLSASMYSINWRDIQITISDVVNAETYAANLGKARTQGAELEFEVRRDGGFRVGGWASYTDATLTADFPAGAAIGTDGERLPYSSRFAGNLWVQQEFPMFAQSTGFARAGVTYIGDRLGEFASGFGEGRQSYPSYTTFDLSAGARFQDWTANLYANNLSDKRGVLAGGLGTLNAVSFTYIQPRTIGFSLAKSF